MTIEKQQMPEFKRQNPRGNQETSAGTEQRIIDGEKEQASRLYEQPKSKSNPVELRGRTVSKTLLQPSTTKNTFNK